jgi:hypothetical protein
MRIVWNPDEAWFQAELGLNEFWQDDMALVRSLGFKTTGPPSWIWHTSKIALLDKLRSQQPKSGLSITELALQKYQFLKQQSDQKKQLKKQFNKAAEELCVSNWKEYIDPETGIVCKEVPPADEPFVWKYIPPAPPEVYCFVCGDPIFNYEYPDTCLWCSKVS